MWEGQSAALEGVGGAEGVVTHHLPPFPRNAIVLHAIMTSFKPEFIALRAIQFAEMIRDCEETGMPRVCVLGCWLCSGHLFVTISPCMPFVCASLTHSTSSMWRLETVSSRWTLNHRTVCHCLRL